MKYLVSTMTFITIASPIIPFSDENPKAQCC